MEYNIAVQLARMQESVPHFSKCNEILEMYTRLKWTDLSRKTTHRLDTVVSRVSHSFLYNSYVVNQHNQETQLNNLQNEPQDTATTDFCWLDMPAARYRAFNPSESAVSFIKYKSASYAKATLNKLEADRPEELINPVLCRSWNC